MAVKVEAIIKKVDRLKADRANWEVYWQDLANFCLPRKAWITSKRTPGEQLRFDRLFDSEAVRDLQTMAAGFNSHLTNPSSRWFSLASKDRRLMKSQNVKLWFKHVEDEIFSTLNTSNFDSTLQEFYLDTGCFGTGTILQEVDFKTRVRFTSIPIVEVLIEEDSRGRVISVYRMFEYTAQQAFGRWGDRAGKAVLDAMSSKSENSRLKLITFVHAVRPREDRQFGKKDNSNMPFESIWIEKSQMHLISESGFEELPYVNGRFNKLTGEVWGFSPAMNALADIRMLNAQKKTLIRAAMKKTDPPFIIPHKGFIQPMNFNPSGANYVKGQTANEQFRVIDTKGDIPIGFQMINDVKADIKRAFFLHVFEAFSNITPGKQMSVPEVQRRIAESMGLLGPVVGRFTQEVFDPLISRTYSILGRLGVLPPPPVELAEQELDIIYISHLAKAQRLSEVTSIENFLVDVRGVAELIPNAVDKVKGDRVVEILADVRGVNPEILQDDEVVDEIRIARAKAEEQQAQIQQVADAAVIAKDAAQAEAALR